MCSPLAREACEGDGRNVVGNCHGIGALAQLNMGCDPVERAVGRPECRPQLVRVTVELCRVLTGLIEEARPRAGERVRAVVVGSAAAWAIAAFKNSIPSTGSPSGSR
ncbi:hypothetical protein DWB77_07416 [Streptomyces hundungensis]|uniref:Uncharacterized protein n=1 Tax=Streptomyces hundungensis TaxID=1077946 RepID=A0A387HNR2_9ACTN|nr:hypothetical protein DWB77_07416 [Streptomyces hundungensis]